MKYLPQILWLCTFPVTILASYYLSLLFLKKTGNYAPAIEEQSEE